MRSHILLLAPFSTSAFLRSRIFITAVVQYTPAISFFLIFIHIFQLFVYQFVYDFYVLFTFFRSASYKGLTAFTTPSPSFKYKNQVHAKNYEDENLEFPEFPTIDNTEVVEEVDETTMPTFDTTITTSDTGF